MQQTAAGTLAGWFYPISLTLIAILLVALALLQGRVRQWCKSHASALWVALVVVIGILLISWGYQVPPDQKKFGDWLNALGQAIFTTGLVAVFLSLPDTSNFLAKIATSLLSSGELLRVLSREAKLELAENLLRDRASDHVTKLHAPLLDHLNRLVDSYLAGPYSTGYRFSVHAAPSENSHSMILSHAVVRYRLHVKHLRRGIFKFPLKYAFQWEVAPDFNDELNSLIKKFRVKVGGEEYDASALQVSIDKLADGTRVRASFDKTFDLSDDADILIETHTLSDPEDPAEMIFVRYPTKGICAQLRNDSASRFDFAVFAPVVADLEAMNRGDPTEGPGNIEVSTSDWILPGCGLALTFVPAKAR